MAAAFLGDRSAMSRIRRDRIRKLLDEAEGYLMLDLPRRALRVLDSLPDSSLMPFETSFLRGEALRCVDRYREAIKPLETAASIRPSDTRVALALGWCYKRTNRLTQAIVALGRALSDNPDEPLLHYNLACYWSLAGDVLKAVDALTIALDLDPELRALVSDEPDFEQLRGNPEFDRLILGPAPLT